MSLAAVKKPRNARSKRALEKRAPQIHEGVKQALFVNASHSSALVQDALHQLSTLKKPYSISFSKKKSNDVNPFTDASSLEFYSQKNDTPLILVGDSRKKRKDNLTWIRCFDGKILDMLEMGIDAMKSVQDCKAKFLPDIGSRPLFSFIGPQFASDAATIYPAHAHLKSLLLDFYRGEEIMDNGIPVGGKVALQGGMQHVISVTAGKGASGAKDSTSSSAPTSLADLYAAGAASSTNPDSAASSSTTTIDNSGSGCQIHFRVYSFSTPPKTPTRAIPAAFTLEECGPSFDFTIRRRQPADPTMLSQSLKRAKTQAEKNRQGKSDTYKKNIDTDEMGDMVGRIHVGKQDLSALQTRKMKGLRADKGGNSSDDGEEDDDDEEDSDDEAYIGLNQDSDDDEQDEADEEEEEEMDRLARAQFDDDNDEPAQKPASSNNKKRGRGKKA
ncbi:unnamed protein product [Sympodiomycopsis kandeliae]